MGCLSDDVLAAYVEREVSPREREEVEVHLGACSDCSAHVASFARIAAARLAGDTATMIDPVRETPPTALSIAPVDGSGGDRLVGQFVAGRFWIEDRIGRGGMGIVYRAHDALLDRPVAIKVISPRLSNDPRVELRFLRECKLAARMSHVNAVMVLDHGRLESGQLYLAMEFLVGRTLREHLNWAMEEPRALHIASQICEALDAAHRLRIVHRDLKPSNIVVLDEPPGRDLIKVLDFGIARSLESDDVTKMTLTGVGVGTPDFSAPEVLAGGGATADERADLYSLGVVLYSMLAGHVPFAGRDRGVTGSPIDPPPAIAHVRDDLNAVIRRLLEFDPDRRFATAAEVRAVLGELAATRLASPRPAATELTAPRPVPAGRTRRWPIALALAILLASMVGVLVATRWTGDGDSDGPPAREATDTDRVQVAPARVHRDEVSTVPAADADAGSVTETPSSARARPKARPKRRTRNRSGSEPAPSRPDAGRPDYFRP